MGNKSEESLRNICNSDYFISLLRDYGIQSADEFFDKYFMGDCKDLRTDINYIFSCHCGVYRSLFTKYYDSYEHSEDSLTVDELLFVGILSSGSVSLYMEPYERESMILDIGTKYEDEFRHLTKKDLQKSEDYLKGVVQEMYPKGGETLYKRVSNAIKTGNCDLDLIPTLSEIESHLTSSDES